MTPNVDRRFFLLATAGGAVASFLPAPAAQAAAPDRLLRRAQARAGGREVLDRVRLLAWNGEAVVHGEDRDIALGVSTTVVPFVTARSRSWPLDQGQAAARTMIITPDDGRVERDGMSAPLPPSIAVHERAQFAMYGLMLLQFHGGRAGLRRVAGVHGLLGMRVDHPKAPKTRLYFESDGRLAEARNVVPGPLDGRPVSQHFYFSREAMPGPVRWPRELRIEQNGRPYFELKLKAFEALI